MRRRIHWSEPSIKEEEVEAVKDAVASGWVGGNGPITREFEKEFARAVNANYAVAVCNGTCGLMAGLLALKEKYNNLISAVPTWTFIATVNVARLLTNHMDLIDCNKETFNMDFSKIPSHSNIIIPVDIGGLPVDYDKLLKLPNRLYTLADSAESLGASYKGQKIGSQADIHLFSLHAAKIITTGEGGVLTTNNKELFNLLVSINNQGYGTDRKSWEYHHSIIGFNFRMTEMQSALGRVQLKKLPIFLRRRTDFAHIYYDILGDKVGYQQIPRDCRSSYFLFTILVDEMRRDEIVQKLFKEGIEVKTWKPIHLQPPYSNRKYSLPNSEYLYRRVINLPIHNALNDEDIKYIAEKILGIIK